MRVIAIDGPAGSGKSTVARAVAQRLGLECLDTGAMYRAVAFAVLRAGGDPSDEGFAASVARNVDLRIDDSGVVVDGVDATVEIRGTVVTMASSLVAAIPAVRSELVARQREWAKRRGGGVLEGRDIGTAVFPDAQLKVHLLADAQVRARRRAQQDSDDPKHSSGLGESGGEHRSVEAVAAELASRDLTDSTRGADPLVVAEDAVVIDTTELTSEETVNRILELT